LHKERNSVYNRGSVRNKLARMFG